MTLREGTRLGAYEILAPLGAGGMGEVYRARDLRLGRDVAVKVLPEGLATDPTARARFEVETRAVAALSHPNLLDIHDVGESAGLAYAVTELLEGEPLSERLKSGPIPWRKAVAYGLAAADGLAAAHARGIVHRDVKPSNIFLTSDGRLKILDFGIATISDEPVAGGVSLGSTDLTATDSLVGTPGFVSPEQIRHRPVDGRSDIFSFGCVLYEMVTGKRAFSGETAAEALTATLRHDVTDPADLSPGLPEDVRLLVLRCLEKSPDRRFQTAGDLAFALRVALSTPTPAESPRPTPAPSRPAPLPAAPTRALSRRRTLAVGLLFVSAAVLLLVVTLRTRHRESIESLAVLPFANETGNPEDDYLSDGISDSLRNSLSTLPRLVVKSLPPGSRGAKGADPRSSGRDLGVQAVVSGRLMRRGTDLVVQADLVDVGSGAQIGGARIVNRPNDRVTAESEIARKIAGSLRPRLTGEEEKRVAGPLHDAVAWDLCLRGRFALGRRTGEGLDQAVHLFQEALARDPNESAAWMGLADTWNLLAYYGALPPREVFPRQREAAERALRIDPSLASAHASLADLSYQYEHDWPGAEKEFLRGLELNPNDVQTLQWYSNFLSAAGRHPEALTRIRKAQELDPLSEVVATDVALASYWKGDYPAALSGLTKVLELAPRYEFGHLWLGLVNFHLGRTDGMLKEWRTLVEISDRNADALAFLGFGLARAGKRAEAEALLSELQSLGARRFVSAFPLAVLNLGLDRRKEALDALERAFEEGAGRLVYLNVERAFDPLRAEPRFAALVRKLAIPSPR